jgi:hypothetical protein
VSQIYNSKTRHSTHWSAHSLEVDDEQHFEDGTPAISFDASSGEYCALLNRKQVADLCVALGQWLDAQTRAEIAKPAAVPGVYPIASPDEYERYRLFGDGAAATPPPVSNDDAIAKVRSWFDVVAARLTAKASASDNGVVSAALREVADAFRPSTANGEIQVTREALLIMSVASLLVLCRLASSNVARTRILDGEVFVDGEHVSDPDAQITTVKRDRFAVRCGDDVAVVKVIG